MSGPQANFLSTNRKTINVISDQTAKSASKVIGPGSCADFSPDKGSSTPESACSAAATRRAAGDSAPTARRMLNEMAVNQQRMKSPVDPTRGTATNCDAHRNGQL